MTAVIAASSALLMVLVMPIPFGSTKLGVEIAPLMLSRAFAVALSWMHIRKRCSIIQVPLPEIHNKTTKINRLTL